MRMTFTDDDLKRLKDSIKLSLDSHEYEPELAVLVTRLEAAEAFVESATRVYPWLKETIAGAIGQHYEASRKAAGK